MRRLHIVGCPRSGTTLLYQMTSSCFENDGFSRHETSIFKEPESCGTLYISKQPNDIRQLRHIFGRDHRLFIIYLERDPRGVITSRHQAHPGQYFCNYRIWRECHTAAQRYSGHPRFLPLRYEDLVSEPDRVQAEIAARFDFLRSRHPFSDHHLHTHPAWAAQCDTAQRVRAVSTSSLGQWRQHLPRVAQQYQQYPSMAAQLIRLGYEQDKQWLDMLRDVPRIRFPCRYPEQRQTLKEWEKNIRVYLKSRRYLKHRRQITRSKSADITSP